MPPSPSGGPRTGEANMTSDDAIRRREESIMEAARTLIGMVRVTEGIEHRRSQKAEFELQVELTAGGTETWIITVERTASSH
jgi:hypothetical protein